MISDARPPLKRSRTQASIDAGLAAKTAAVRVALADRISLVHLVNTVLDADRLIHQLQGGEASAELSETLRLHDTLYSRWSLERHLHGFRGLALRSLRPRRRRRWR